MGPKPRSLTAAYVVFASLTLATIPAQECIPSSSSPEVDVSTPDGSRRYIDWECVGLDTDCFAPSFWYYDETNGIDGLQRRDEQADDTCHGMIPSDDVLTMSDLTRLPVAFAA